MRKLSNYSWVNQESIRAAMKVAAQESNFNENFGLTKNKYNLIVTFKANQVFVRVSSFDVNFSYHKTLSHGLEKVRVISSFTPNRDLVPISKKFQLILNSLLEIELDNWVSTEFEESLENLESVLKIKSLLKF